MTATRTAKTVVLYAGGRLIRTVRVKGRRVDEIVTAQLASCDESAEAVVLDERGHRIERWCRRGADVVREWGLPGAIVPAPPSDVPSSIPPAPGS